MQWSIPRGITAALLGNAVRWLSRLIPRISLLNYCTYSRSLRTDEYCTLLFRLQGWKTSTVAYHLHRKVRSKMSPSLNSFAHTTVTSWIHLDSCADPLHLCRVGRGPSVRRQFQVSLEIFGGVYECCPHLSCLCAWNDCVVICGPEFCRPVSLSQPQWNTSTAWCHHHTAL